MRYCYWHIRLLCLTILLSAGLTACVGKGKDTVYPPPENLALAPVQRQEFVDFFLQGRWCQAKALFEQSVENYLRQDDFCRSAYNFYLLYKIKGYIGINAPEDLAEAKRLAKLTESCTSVPVATSSAPTPKDVEYTALLDSKQFTQLLGLLKKDKDPLYASVYARKIAIQAQRDTTYDVASTALSFAKQLDAQQGWIVFLVEDWKLLSKLASNDVARKRIDQRIKILQNLIHPCVGQ
ncbi:MAG: hypothetical protein ACNI3A_04145 [Desulfovibrio sp.]|uniref:hypothetical protein n=1 Tax=Desulfovibrio sp. 7SRBS1 TaxID=3378064 RepID=UPI003B3F1145